MHDYSLLPTAADRQIAADGSMRKLATLRTRCNWSDSCPCLIQTQRNRRTVIKQGKNYIFTARCYASAVLAMALCPGCYQFCCLVNRGTMGVNSLPKTATRRRRDCDLNPGPSAPESSTLTTRLPNRNDLPIIRGAGTQSKVPMHFNHC